ncbi:IS1634 family transposase [Solobacterium moorei]|uniref:IS1634 family transposase n=1 Tax=Solobacterium moorei TaxID=102148 RepID=UPI002B2C7622|nr:hypothetical protein RGT18_22770 [Solobacterium moorei]
MAYFLKVAKQQNNTYLAVYESFYSPATKGTKHRCIRSLGSVSKLKAAGIDDPVAFYKDEVEKMNLYNKQDKIKKITSVSPRRYLGYFPLKSILEDLDIKKFIDLYKFTTDFEFELYEVLSLLVYARCVSPCSKYKTYYEILPQLHIPYAFNYDQLLSALAFYGNDYEKIVELFTSRVKDKYSIDTAITYFDCTNFYFEIDREDDFRRKGPSKENRKAPVIGLGLLLDANQIPVGMKLYPGNESEKPVLKDVLKDLKERHEVHGKTIRVADKGLNCSENILSALANGDGYLFSKSVKQLPETEKVWVLLPNDYKAIKDRNGKIIYYCKECIDEFPYTYTDESGKKKKVNIKEKRVVTYNPTLARKHKYEINKLVEKAKGLSVSLVKKNEYGESAKYVTFRSTSNGEETEDKVKAIINQETIDNDLKLAGYNMLVTSETKVDARQIYETYHNLWRIEESFRIMKSDLDARPVYLQLENTIKGHFLICYLTVLLQRIFQFKVLENKYSSSELNEFYKGFQFVEGEDSYTNISIGTNFITELSDMTGLPLDNYFLSPTKLKKVLNYRF